MWELAVVGLCLVAIIGAYFGNNPLRHGRRFIWRRFYNWFPLGMTYSFLYMGRYNLVSCKTALGGAMSNDQFGNIFGIGTAVYALSFLINGPFVDWIGGKRGILISGFGVVIMNVLLGFLTLRVTAGAWHGGIVLPYALLYAGNMYFQSYGACSIIKVKSYWFHVRERGVFGAIFGSLISLGLYFAFDWNAAIVKHISIPAVFFIPAGIILLWTISDLWAVVDTPEEAGFASFDTHDASSGHMDDRYSYLQLLGKVFASPLMWMVALLELTSGVFRNGVQQWYPVLAVQVPAAATRFISHNWGFLLCVTGIAAGFGAGLASDKLFQSRRGPPAGILCGLVLVLSLTMWFTFRAHPWMFGGAAIIVVMGSVGITSLMSGTAATDFGGRKATATCAGVVDGFAYLGSSIQSVCLGHVTEGHWHWWPLFFVPFAILGGGIALRIWNDLPPATRRYIQEVELKNQAAEAAVV
ncbi:MAG TPA: MFS transporter [Opitutaceae bacterium]|jgi:OPA family glycerol-3-phosphate transporter-like MFS transporter|nr:MFS transporter [Opitutaceae bacterium]